MPQRQALLTGRDKPVDPVATGHIDQEGAPNKHAIKHFNQTKHPIIKSFEPGEAWGLLFGIKSFSSVFKGLSQTF